MKSIFVISISLLVLLCKAQDPKADFKKINSVYHNLEKMKVNVKYELFFDNDSKAADTEEGVYKRNKDNYYLLQTGNEMIVNDNYSIVIDNDTKVVILEKAIKKSKTLNPLKIDLDSIFHFYQKVSFYKTGKNNELHAYTFTLKSGLFSQIDVVFDPATYHVKEITNVYRDKMPDMNEKMRTAKLKTIFSNLSVDPVFTDDFNEAKYVRNDHGKIKPVGSYSSYKVLTNLKKL